MGLCPYQEMNRVHVLLLNDKNSLSDHMFLLLENNHLDNFGLGKGQLFLKGIYDSSMYSRRMINGHSYFASLVTVCFVSQNNLEEKNTGYLSLCLSILRCIHLCSSCV